jgi:predicted NAD-dependent protein-ADP-ribosyltransferase YbiA (DUF1768 family)
MNAPKKIKFNQNSFLSNFSKLPKPIIYKFKSYSTSEHLYQAKKYLDQPESAAQEYAEQIRLLTTPFKAKILGNMWTFVTHHWQNETKKLVLKYKEKNVVCSPT